MKRIVTLSAVIFASVVSLHAQFPNEVKWLTIQTDKPALLFSPGDAVSVTLQIKPGTGQSLSWVAVNQQEREMARAAAPVALSTNEPTTVSIDLGKPAEGFYVVRLAVTGGKNDVRTVVPVAVFGPPPSPDDSVKEPFFPVGVYDKYIINRDRIMCNTYLHAVCWTLRRAGLNAITSGNTVFPATVEQMDIAASWGVRVMVRADICSDPKVLNHPNAVALMYGDEPKTENIPQYKAKYDELKAAYPNKQVLTCMVGDSIGARGGHDPADVWNLLQPTTRFARFYPIRRNHYDLTHRRIAIDALPATAVFQLISTYNDTPWWFASQTFGQIATETRPEAYWGNPTPAELSGLTHLALAHGAKGLFGWAFQTHWQAGGKDVPCLVTQETLMPEDGKWQTWLDIAKFVTRFKTILLDAKRGGCEPAAERSELEVVPRQTSDGRKLIYVVNTDTRNVIESELWLFVAHVLSIRDLVADRDLPLTPGRWGRLKARVKLQPGEGRLYEVKIVDGPITADRIDTKSLLPIETNPIEPLGPDEKDLFKQVQALPAWWKFSADTNNVGQTNNWFAPDFDDSSWGYLRVGTFWDNLGVKLQKSHAWYRTSFVPSRKATGTKPLKLLFLGVDESAWVWLNGELICTHYPDNVDGWDRSFAIDVTGKLKPGQPNALAVRVLNRTASGGIYGKVALVTPTGKTR